MTKHFPCPLRLCIDSKGFSMIAIAYPAHWKMMLKGVRMCCNFIQSFPKNCEISWFYILLASLSGKGGFSLALKATSTSIIKVLFLFSFYPASVECDSQGVKMEFKTTTYHQSQETREDAFVSRSPHKAELTLGVHKDLFTFGEQVLRF